MNGLKHVVAVKRIKCIGKIKLHDYVIRRKRF